MPQPAESAANLRRTAWDVTFKTTSLGLVDKVTPDLNLVYEAIKVGTTGNMRLGDRFVDMAGTIKVQVRELSRDMQEDLTPWFAGAAGAVIPLTPAPGTDLYSLAGTLLLHPHDKGATTTEDVEFFKACPVTSPVKLERDGMKDDVWEIEFIIYPDRTKIGTANNPWGQVKGT